MKVIDAISALAGLAQETRLEIFRLLVQKGPEGLPAGKIGERFDLPAPTLSFHLAHLERCDLLTSRREGRMIIYSANYQTMNDLMAYLSENCCGGDTALCPPGACADSVSKTPVTKRYRSHETHARTRRR